LKNDAGGHRAARVLFPPLFSQLLSAMGETLHLCPQEGQVNQRSGPGLFSPSADGSSNLQTGQQKAIEGGSGIATTSKS
jgi:hypothetical protein